MLIASVKMNALNSPLTTSSPLKVPTARPTASTTKSPTHGLHSVPSPSLAFGAMSQAPSSAARPNVPWSEMSNLPVIRISDSATTTMPSAAPPCATLTRFEGVRKTGFTSAPPIISRTITGTSVRSRIQFSAMSLGSRRTTRAVGCFTVVSPIHPLHRGDEPLPVPGRPLELGRDAAADHHQESRAHPEVLEVVRHQEHRHAGAARLVHRVQERLLRGDVDADRRVHDHQQRGFLRERPADDHLLLIAAAQARHRLLERGGDDLQAPHLLGGDPVAGLERDDPEQPARDTRQDREREVLADAQLWRKAPRVPVLGHVAGTASERGIDPAWWHGPPVDADGPRLRPQEADHGIGHGGASRSLVPDEAE